MKYIELRGTARQIGRTHGEAFREDIAHWYDFYFASRGKRPENLDPSIRRYSESHFPDLIEEIRGLAEGAGMTYEQMLAWNHFTVVQGCTPLYLRNTPRGPLAAQTLDCDPEEQQAVLVRNVRPAEGQAYLCASFVGTVWTANFVNESGLCRAAVSAHHKNQRTTDGTCGSLIEAHVVRTARSLDEAFAIYSAHRWLRKVGVHLLCDRDGGAIFVEGTADEKFRTEVEGDFAYSTGLFVSGKVQAEWNPPYLLPKYARALTLERLHHAGKIEYTVEGMKRLLATHAPEPGSVCRHDRSTGLCTVSGRIMIPAEGKLLICDGRPCEAAFEEFTLI
jgi:isopenicillin-N N-acyltransferase-like protein